MDIVYESLTLPLTRESRNASNASGLVQQEGADQPAAALESKSDDDLEPEPELDGQSR